ncbi:signal peptidase II [bacterium]|nr:signal peptidase II [bacterium]
MKRNEELSPEPLTEKKNVRDNDASEKGETEDTVKPRKWAPPRQWIIALAIAVFIVAIDQISKLIVVRNIPLNSWITLIDPILKLTYAQNEVGIFSISFGPKFMHILLPLIAMCFVLYLLSKPQKMFVTVLLGMILGGGMGNNLIDRLRLGYVVDWISMGFPKWRWATYNLADLSVVVAVIILLIVELFFNKPKAQEENKGTLNT